MHSSAVGDVMSYGANQIITGSFDGTIKTAKVDGTDIAETSASQKIQLKGSDFEMGPRVISYDGKKVYIGNKTNQIVSCDAAGNNCKIVVDGHDDQVWGLTCHPKAAFVCTGGYDNCIKIWNKDTKINTETFLFPTTTNEKGKEIGEQVTALTWAPTGSLLAVGTESSKVFLFSFGGSPGSQLTLADQYLVPPKSKRAATEAVDYLRFNTEGTLLACCHMDARTYIFSCDGGKLNRWKKGLDEVAAPSHVNFSKDSSLLRVFTRDYEISYWDLDSEGKKGTRAKQQPDPDNVEWMGDPIIAGWDTCGLYQAEWDGTDLNDCTLSRDKKYVVSGDDYGFIRVHNYPAINREKNNKYGGHSAFVVGVQFTGQGDFLMSVGGNDYAIFQWALQG